MFYVLKEDVKKILYSIFNVNNPGDTFISKIKEKLSANANNTRNEYNTDNIKKNLTNSYIISSINDSFIHLKLSSI